MADPDLPFLQHLEALRRVIRQNLIVLALLVLPGWFCAGYLMELYIGWAAPPELARMHYFTPMEVLLAELKTGFLLALAAGMPLILWQWWSFLAPALYRHERRRIAGFVVSGFLLFLAGAAFALGVIMPLVMNFALSYSSDRMVPVLRLSDFLSLALALSLAFGVMFQMPLAVMTLCRAGLVSADALRRKRPVVIVVVLIVAAVLTPPDVVSQVLLALPTLALFEVGLLLAGRSVPEAAAEALPAEETPEGPEAAENGLEFYRRAGRRKKGRRIRGSRR